MENLEKQAGEKEIKENSEREIEKVIEERKRRIKEKFKNYIKDKNNLIFLLIFIFAIAIRFYYFLLTKNQPLWWDEAEYMSAAKGFAGIIDFKYSFALNRFPGFPLITSLFYVLGITNESVLKFFLTFLPSLIVIFILYFVMKEMYSDKRIAIISVAILTLLWEHVFYSNRFHTENLSLISGFLTIFILFKVYIKKENFYFIKSKYALLYILIFSLLCILFRSGNMIFLPIVILFMLVLNFYRFPKKFRIVLIMLFASLFVLFLFTSEPLAKKYEAINMFYHYELPIAWNDLTVFYGFYQSFVSYIPSVLFYAFLLGIISFFINIILAPELLKRLNLSLEYQEIKADIFNIILIFTVLFFFIFMLRQEGFEYRWFFILLPGMLAFTSKGIIKFSEYMASLVNLKKLSIILILVVMILGLYAEWNHADNIVKYKISSYQQVKDSGLWLKENTNKEDVIISASQMQHAYYAERKIENFYVNNSNENETAFNEKIREIRPKFIVISVFEPVFTPKWAYDWPQRHNETAIPVQVYFLDNEKKQVALVIYEFKNYDF